MRQIKLVMTILALATAACVCAGPSVSPTLQPVATNPPVGQNPPSQSPSTGTGGDGLSPEEIEQIMLSSVQVIIAQDAGGGQLQQLGHGSGTIISPDGEILTNCHVACGAPLLVVAMTTDPALPPEPAYFAEITHFDEEIDLALLRLTSDIDGNPISSPNLPYVEVGNSDELRLGDQLYIFGYPAVGGETITFTEGNVSGFESANVGGASTRYMIKTDGTIAPGNSGGTAVDLNGRLVGIPTLTYDIREGVPVGAINILMAVNLVPYIRQQAGAPPITSGPSTGSDPDPFEPNDDLNSATGPLAPGDSVNAFISWDQDIDVYFIQPSTTAPITVQMEGPAGTDYDIGLLDQDGNVLAKSDSEGSSESFTYNPLAADGYWIIVVGYSGATANETYFMTVNFDNGAASGGTGGGNAGGISITGQVVSGSTGNALSGGQFGLLAPGVTCSQFFNASTWDLSQVVAAAETNSQGYFTLTGVPEGATYSAYFLYAGMDTICEDNWLDIPTGQGNSDIGQITIDE